MLAVGAYKRRIDFYDILHDQRSDPGIKTLSENTQVLGDAELDETYPDLYRSVLEVETKSGAWHSRDLTHPKGSPQNPLSREALQQKFARLTADVLPASRGEQIAEAVYNIEKLPDIGILTRLLATDT